MKQHGVLSRLLNKAELLGPIRLTVTILFMLFLTASSFSSGNDYLCLAPDGKAGAKSLLRFVDGIPFITGNFWSPKEGDSAVVHTAGLKAQKMYILGGLNSIDLTHPAWGGGDGFENFSETRERVRPDAQSGRSRAFVSRCELRELPSPARNRRLL